MYVAPCIYQCSQRCSVQPVVSIHPPCLSGGLQTYDKLDEKYGDKPAKMVQKLATGVEGSLMGA